MSTSTSTKNANHSVEMFKKYRNLLLELTRKNINLKYRNSWLGIFWSFLQPLLNMIVMSVVFSGLFGRGNKNIICYPVFLFTGRLIYEFFSTSTRQAMVSFRHNAAIIKKVYVPKYMYPLSSIFSTFVNLAMSLLCFVGVWIFFKLTGISNGHDLEISWHALLFFIPMILVLIFSTGVGLILSVLEVYFRDIEYIWQVVTRLLLYMVPILYPIESITTDWIVYVIKINPLYSYIEMFRDVVFYGQMFNMNMLVYGVVCAIASLLIGVIVFDRKSDDIVYHL